MRIAIDCRCVFRGCGGIGNYTLALVRALARVNAEDEFVLLSSDLTPRLEIVNQANFVQHFQPAAMLDADWEQLQLPSVLAELGVDLYHNPTFALPIVRPCKAVATIHDVVFHFRPDLVREGLREYLQRWTEVAAHTADRIVTVSRHSREALIAAYGVDGSRIDVTYEAADRDRFRPAYGGAREDEFRARYGVRGPFILYVGALEPKKNLDRLLDAFAEARAARGLTHSLVLAGGDGGMPYDAREAIAERDLQAAVVVTGFLPDDLLPRAYNAADVFVYPSLYEGFGLPVLEAMACGTPAVVSQATSLPEVAGDAAVLVDPLDTSALAAALVAVATDRDLHESLRVAGLRRAEQFSWQRTALDTLRCYQSAVDG
jgi:glycosyltransferase involved in cell wall biosynthesis